MTKSRSLSRIATIAGFCILAVLLLLIATPYLISSGAYLQIYHLLFGFWFFLRDNLKAASPNADTWVPGLLAFIAALWIAHLYVAKWARMRGVHWSAASTLALGMFLPVLFALAFLVPGILFHARSLAEEPMMLRSRGSDAMLRNQLENFWMFAQDSALENKDGKFPETLDAYFSDSNPSALRRLDRQSSDDPPPEPPIYLGNFLNHNSDPELPLAITGPFLQEGHLHRLVINVRGEITLIRDQETHDWIIKAWRTWDGG